MKGIDNLLITMKDYKKGIEAARFLFKIPNQKLMAPRLAEEERNERYNEIIQRTRRKYRNHNNKLN
jgi:hypothetical protein